MKTNEVLRKLRTELEKELREHILEYWVVNAVDDKHGGFYGRVNRENQPVEHADKSSVLNSRILWTFAAAHRLFGKQHYKDTADRAYAYSDDKFWDVEQGGIYWMVDYRGIPSDSRKHMYAQAFALYGYSEYYRATSHTYTLDRAIELFNLIEKYGFDPVNNGYHESFDQAWKPLDDARLSEDNAKEMRSMNTHLHILEAYENLYRVWPDKLLHTRLKDLLELFMGPMYNSTNHYFYSFFDETWKPRSRVYSFGHDVEASWLINDAARTLGEPNLMETSERLVREVCAHVLQEGVDTVNGGVYDIGDSGTVTNSDKQWWVQAEAIVGFIDAYQKTGNSDYVDASMHIWSFIKDKVIDKKYGDWFFKISETGMPYLEEDKIGPWKCPYHSARACMEVLSRVDTILSGEDVNSEMTPDTRTDGR